MFHDTKGKNVKFDNKKSTATWVPIETGGHLFSAQCLRPDKNVVLKLVGTGGIELGIVSVDPSQLARGLASCGERDDMYQFLNDVKIHKRSCELTVNINYETQEVTSTYGCGVYTQRLKTNKKYWLVVDVKYGKVEIMIQNEGAVSTMYSFSKRTGQNIEVQHDDTTIARSLAKSPASLCIYGSPVKPGQILLLKTAPREYQGTIPGRYYVQLFLTNLKPDKLLKQHPDRFDVSSPKTETPDWTTIEKFEKDDCRGTICLEFQDRLLKYKFANGKRTSQEYKNIQPDRQDMWLVLEIYGVSVRLEDRSRQDGSRLSNQRTDHDIDSDEIDARPSPMDDHHLPPILEQDEATTAVDRRNQGTNYTNRQQQACFNGESTERDQVSLEKGIRKHFTDLKTSLILPDFVDVLYQKDYITMEQMEEFHRPDVTQTRKLLVLMSKKRIQRSVLREALDKSGQLFLLEKFLNEEEKP